MSQTSPEIFAADIPPTTADEAVKRLQETERLRMQERDAAARKLRAVELRIKALYHNCMSSACFLRSDAEREESEEEQITKRREAQSYEVVAGWLNNAFK